MKNALIRSLGATLQNGFRNLYETLFEKVQVLFAIEVTVRNYNIKSLLDGPNK